MTVPELLPTLHDLDRSDKLRVIQFLVSELAQEDHLSFFTEATYPIWSPYTDIKAENALLAALAADNTGKPCPEAVSGSPRTGG